MTISAEQLRLRHHVVGSSEVAALFGRHPFATEVDLFWSKRFDLAGLSAEEYYASRDKDRTDQQEVGDEIEPVLVKWCGKRLGRKVRTMDRKRQPLRDVDEKHHMAASYDGLVVGRKEAVECKTTTWGDWGDEGTDEVPEHVVIQAQSQMAVGGLQRVHVPVLKSSHFGMRFAYYKVERNEQMILAIRVAVRLFWEQHVVPGVRPLGSEQAAPLELYKMRAPTSGKIITEPSKELVGAVVAWERGKAVLKDLGLRKDAAEALMLAQLEDAEEVRLPDGRILTRKRQVKNQLDRDKLDSLYPDVVKVCTSQIVTNPMLKILKGTSTKGKALPSEPSTALEASNG